MNKNLFKLDTSIDKHIDDVTLRRILNITTAATGLIATTSFISNTISGNYAVAIADSLRGIGIFLFWIYANRTGNLSKAVLGVMVISLFGLTALMLLSGGLSSLHLYWLIVLPPITLMLLSRKVAILAALTIGLTLVGLIAYSGTGDLPTFGHPEGWRRAFSAILCMGVTMLVSHMTLGWRDGLAAKIDKENAIKQSEHVRKNRFFVHMNHEIRNPLNALIASIDLLNQDDELVSKGGLSEQELGAIESRRKSLVSAMKTTSVHIQSIVNDVLEIERLESTNAPELNKQFSLREFGEGIVEVLKAKSIAANADLVVRYKSGLHDLWIGNAPRIRQVILNLASNALQHSGAKDVSITFSEVSNGLQFEVNDNGKGMTPETLEKMFQPFSSGILEAGYSGLGLGICKLLVEKNMSGVLKVHSELGHGTTFTVSLPMARSLVAEQYEYGNSSLKKSPEIDLRGLRLLMVEDSPEIGDAMKLTFEGRGFNVDLAKSSQEAMSIVESRKDFAVILVDLNLGIVSIENGIALTKRLVQQGFNRIIGFTGNHSDQINAEWVQAGVSTVIQKPTSVSTLLTEITKLVAQDNVENGGASASLQVTKN